MLVNHCDEFCDQLVDLFKYVGSLVLKGSLVFFLFCAKFTYLAVQSKGFIKRCGFGTYYQSPEVFKKASAVLVSVGELKVVSYILWTVSFSY